jgi:GT2 family glycosyltransferase
MASDLTIIVVTFNSSGTITKCLASLPSDAGSQNVEVIVVDNDSQDDTAAIVRRFRHVKLILNGENLGFASACNIGAHEAAGKNLLFLNPDAFVVGDAIDKIVAFEKSVGGGTIVGGLVKDHNAKTTSSIREFPSVRNQFSESLFLYKIFPNSPAWGAYHYSNVDRDNPMNVDAVEGSFFLIPKLVFEQLGGFDEHFFLYSEDTDLCYRARQMNIPVVFYPGAVAVHAGPEASSRVSRRYILAMHLAQLKFIRRHFRGSTRIALETLKIIGLLIRVPVYLLISLATMRTDRFLKAAYTLEAGIRGIFSSDPPRSLFN